MTNPLEESVQSEIKTKEIWHDDSTEIKFKKVINGMTSFKGKVTLTNKKLILGENLLLSIPLDGALNIQILNTFGETLGIHVLNTSFEFELKTKNMKEWMNAFEKLQNIKIKRKWV